MLRAASPTPDERGCRRAGGGRRLGRTGPVVPADERGGHPFEMTPRRAPTAMVDGVDEAAWRGFLDKDVTPRFPSGLTVVDAYGQWQGKQQAQPERLRSKIVVLLYPDTPAARASVDAIRAAWKAKTGDQSVLRVTQPADVSF